LEPTVSKASEIKNKRWSRYKIQEHTFYFRSLVSCVLWVPMFVLLFLYFVSLSPFIVYLLWLGCPGFRMFVFIFLYFVSESRYILDLLWLVYCGLVCVFALCIFITFYFRFSLSLSSILGLTNRELRTKYVSTLYHVLHWLKGQENLKLANINPLKSGMN
jgi:hypothetical protein